MASLSAVGESRCVKTCDKSPQAPRREFIFGSMSLFFKRRNSFLSVSLHGVGKSSALAATSCSVSCRLTIFAAPKVI